MRLGILGAVVLQRILDIFGEEPSRRSRLLTFIFFIVWGMLFIQLRGCLEHRDSFFGIYF